MSQAEVNTKCNCCCGQDSGQNPEFKMVDEIIEKHRDRKGALMPILNDIQSGLGYLPKYAMEEISRTLDIPLAEIYGVATFYSRFTLKPRGQHTISVCLGTACYVKGAQKVFDKLAEVLNLSGSGETTDDGKFTLEATRCLGCCGLAPVMTVDEDVYGKLVPEDVHEILKKY